MKILVQFLLLIALVNKLQMQEIPDCMCMPYSYPPHNPEYYLDSAFLIDTCDIQYKSQDCDSSMWLNCFYTFDFRERIYAKKEWLVWFDVKAFPLPVYNPDTLIELTWMDVDSINYPEIKDSLQNIQVEYGNFKMIKRHPDLTETIHGQSFLVYFDNYVNGVEVENRFRAIQNTKCDFQSNLSPIGVNGNFQEKSKQILIFPNPASEYIEIAEGARHAVPVWNEQIQIFNIYGEQMYNFVGAQCPDIIGMPLRIDISNFPDGMYFVKLSESSKLSESYRMYKFVVIK